MSDRKEARALAVAAERDVAALRGMGDAAVFADEIFGFHVQQAAEKLLKAWLALLGETYPLSHDLAALLDMLTARGVDIGALRRTGGLHALCRSPALRGRRSRRGAARPRRGARAGGRPARRPSGGA